MTAQTPDPWDYKNIDDITKGVDVSQSPNRIDDGAFVEAVNLFYNEKKLLTDTGYAPYLAAVRGTPKAKIVFLKRAGTSEDILITNETVYTRVSSQWQYVAGATPTTMAVGGVATDTTIDVVDASQFGNGDYIGIELDDGTQHQTTVNGAPVGNTITLTDALPSAAAIGNTVLEPVVLTGNDSNQVSWDIYPAFDYLLFTNNVDPPQYYDGSTCQDIPNLPSAGNTLCRAIKVFESLVMLLGTTEGGTKYPQRVRWCDTADPTTWTPADNNVAGYEDLYDSEDGIMDGASIGPYFIVYRQLTITRCELVQTTERLLKFDTVITNEGILGTNCVADIGSEHILAGGTGFYSYSGGFELTPLDEKAWPRLYGKDRELDITQAPKTAFVSYIQELDEVWFFYPLVMGDFCARMARYNFITQSWTFRDYNIEISAVGYHKRSTTLTWSALVGSWLAQTFRWGSSSAAAGAPTIILMSKDGGNQCYEYDYTTATDNGVAIGWSFVTKDFYHPRHAIRTNWIDFQAKGSLVNIEYSIDGGQSYNTWGSKTLTSSFKKRRSYKQVVSDRIRWKFSGTSSDFGIDWFGFEFRIESTSYGT